MNLLVLVDDDFLRVIAANVLLAAEVRSNILPHLIVPLFLVSGITHFLLIFCSLSASVSKLHTLSEKRTINQTHLHYCCNSNPSQTVFLPVSWCSSCIVAEGEVS